MPYRSLHRRNGFEKLFALKPRDPLQGGFATVYGFQPNRAVTSDFDGGLDASTPKVVDVHPQLAVLEMEMTEHVGGSELIVVLEPLARDTTRATVVEREYADREDEAVSAGLDEVLVDLKLHPDVPVLVADGRLGIAFDDLDVEEGGVVDQFVLDGNGAVVGVGHGRHSSAGPARCEAHLFAELCQRPLQFLADDEREREVAAASEISAVTLLSLTIAMIRSFPIEQRLGTIVKQARIQNV